MSYQNMLESDGTSSEDTSQSHEGFQCTEKKDAGFIRARFRYFWGPLVLGLSAEILLILAVLRYEKKNWDEMLPVLQQLDLDASNLSGPGFQFVFVFVACLVGRILTLWGWRWTLCRGKDSQFGAIFMGFNCLQWLVYFWLYYALMDLLVQQTPTRTVKARMRALPYNMTPADERLPCADNPSWRDQDGASCADYAASISQGKIMCNPGENITAYCPASCNVCSPGLERFVECLKGGSNLYGCQSASKVAVWQECTKPYDNETCWGYVDLPVKYSMEYSSSSIQCCVEVTWKLSFPNTRLMTLLGDDYDLGLTDILGLLKWVAVLVMTWSIQESPFLLPSPASSDFMKTVWLDLLDSLVMFSRFFQSDLLLLPQYGVQANGHPSPEGDSDALRHWFGITWWIASLGSVLSPIVYTWFRHRESQASKEQGGTPLLTNDAVLQELAERVRVLDRQGAVELLEKSIQMTQADIAEKGVHPTRVKVRDADASPSVSTWAFAHIGHAIRERNKVTYSVEYDDGTSEDGVELERLQPTTKQPRTEAAHRCTGWCHPAYLFPKSDPLAALQRRAMFLNALRSMLTLELPFFAWRMWFWLGGTKGLLLLMAKNLVFGLRDLCIILAWGREDARVLGFAPAAVVSSLSKVVNSVQKAGPGALMSDAAKYALRALSRAEAQLQLKKAFLQQERYLALMRDGEDVAQGFDEIITQVNADLEDQREMLKHLHT